MGQNYNITWDFAKLLLVVLITKIDPVKENLSFPFYLSHGRATKAQIRRLAYAKYVRGASFVAIQTQNLAWAFKRCLCEYMRSVP